VCFIEWLQQIVLIAGNCIDRNGMERIEVVVSRVKWRGVLMEHDVRVAGDTADIETGQILIIKLSLCPITFCNYKCLNIRLFQNSAFFYTSIYYQSQSIHTQPIITVDTTPYSIKRCLCPIAF
jgi:hypothetical protein